jgi:tetratricopeptide (TPR) repeat protein
MIRSVVWVVVVAVVAAPGVAAADGPCDAEAAAVRGKVDPSLTPPTNPTAVARMKSGNDHHREALKRAAVVATRDQAAAEFQAAIDDYVAAAMASPSPSVLYNLAQTYRAAGHYEDAIAQYRLFLDRGRPGAGFRKLIECQIGAMAAELERAASAAPPRGPGPENDPDEDRDRSPDSLTTTATDPDHDSSGVAPEFRVPSPTPRAEPWHADPLGWTLAGGGVAVGALGAFFLLDARSLRSDAEGELRDDVREELRDKADTRQTWGTVGATLGGALLVAGVVKLALVPDAPRAGVAVRIAPTSITIAGAF